MFVKEEHIVDKQESTLRFCQRRLQAPNLFGERTACPTVEKNPFTIRATMKESNVADAAHHAAVTIEIVKNQNNIGARPK